MIKKIMPPSLYSDQEREKIVNNLLNTKSESEIWIFGYGSLMWNPGFHFNKSVLGVLEGFHREYCIWSSSMRGTLEKPGLSLGLRKEGTCTGISFCLPEIIQEEELKKVVFQEIETDNYIAKWLPVNIGTTTIQSVVLIANENSNLFTGNLSFDETIFCIATAKGKKGTCLDYFLNTLEIMEKLGIVDSTIQKVQKGVYEFLNRKDIYNRSS